MTLKKWQFELNIKSNKLIKSFPGVINIIRTLLDGSRTKLQIFKNTRVHVCGYFWVHVCAFWVHVYGAVGCMYAVVGCMYAETFGCMYAEVGCKFHNGRKPA